MKLMPALSEECHRLRLDANVKRVAIANAINKGQSVVERFERKETWPNGREIDTLVETYSSFTLVPVEEIWQAALDRAKAQPEEASPDAPNDFDPDAAVAAATEVARRADRSREAQEQASIVPRRSSKKDSRKRTQQ